MKEVMIFEQLETPMQSIASDTVTFGGLLLCIWFSWFMGGGWWTVFTTAMFLVSMAIEMPGGVKQRWVRLETKREAIKWANALPDDVKGAEQ